MNIELPKDAEGREIPLDTSELFIADGTKVRALRFEYMYHTSDARDAWFVYIERTPGEHMTLHACDVRLIQPDSWEKLLEDLDKIINGDDVRIVCCKYFGADGKDCSGCSQFPYGNCDIKMVKDIASRIRKLRGEDE
jgi:hypothetical protein